MNLLNVPLNKQEELLQQVEDFFILRLKNIYLDREVPHHILDLLLSNRELTVADVDGYVKALQANRIDENVELVQAYTRMYNLVKDVTFIGVNESLLTVKAEQDLFAVATIAAQDSLAAWLDSDYDTIVALPNTLVPTINKFFEGVMVMDKDEAIKNNRLQLLRLAYNVMAIIGDISALK